MGEHAHPAGVADEPQRVHRVERVLRHVGDAAVGDEPVEGLLLGGDDPRLDHRLRDVGAGDEIVAGDRAHPLERDVVAELLQLLDHQLAAAKPRIGEAPELLDQGRIRRVDPVRQHVQRRAVVLGGELDPRHDAQAGALGGGRRLGVAPRSCRDR